MTQIFGETNSTKAEFVELTFKSIFFTRVSCFQPLYALKTQWTITKFRFEIEIEGDNPIGAQ